MAFFFFSSNPLPFLLLLLILFPAASSAGNATATLPDVLAFFNMPRGLFSNNVTSFSLDGSTGALRVNISGDGCYLPPPDNNFYIKSSVTGRLRNNFLSDISGIQTPRYWYFDWYDVNFIQVDLDPARYIHFETSVFTTTCPIAQFSTVRPCSAYISPIFQSFRSTKDCRIHSASRCSL